MASKASTKLLRVLTSEDAGFEDEWRALFARRGQRDEALRSSVAGIIERVRMADDHGLRRISAELDGVRLGRLELTRDEWDAACEQLDPADRAAIGKAAMRIREFHRKRVPSSWEMREEGGAYMGQRVRPLSRVGIFATAMPGVRPTQVIMNTVPASVVEVPEIILLAAPQEDGQIAPEILMAAKVSGVHRVVRIGGAHGVAALAFGSGGLPRVDAIVGGGDPHADEAKRQLSHLVAATDEGTEPEVCIVADKSATPAWIASEVLGHLQCESSAAVLLISHHKSIFSRVQEQITKQLKGCDQVDVLKERLVERALAVQTRTLDASIELANDFAPEHVLLAVENAESASKGVQNAGTIFMGHYTPVAVGSYMAGPNGVLPPAGSARFASPRGVEDFLKRTNFVKLEPPKLRELGGEVIRLAEMEGKPARGTSVELRLQRIRRARREREAAREAEL